MAWFAFVCLVAIQVPVSLVLLFFMDDPVDAKDIAAMLALMLCGQGVDSPHKVLLILLLLYLWNDNKWVWARVARLSDIRRAGENYNEWYQHFHWRLVLNPKRILFISHPWYTKNDPDPSNYIKQHILTLADIRATPETVEDAVRMRAARAAVSASSSSSSSSSTAPPSSSSSAARSPSASSVSPAVDTSMLSSCDYLWYDEISIYQKDRVLANAMLKYNVPHLDTADEAVRKGVVRLLCTIPGMGAVGRGLHTMVVAVPGGAGLLQVLRSLLFNETVIRKAIVRTMHFVPAVTSFYKFEHNLEYNQRYRQDGYDEIADNRFWICYENFKGRYDHLQVKFEADYGWWYRSVKSVKVFHERDGLAERLEAPDQSDERVLVSMIIGTLKTQWVLTAWSIISLHLLGVRVLPFLFLELIARKYLGLSIIIATRTVYWPVFLAVASIRLLQDHVTIRYYNHLINIPAALYSQDVNYMLYALSHVVIDFGPYIPKKQFLPQLRRRLSTELHVS